VRNRAGRFVRIAARVAIFAGDADVNVLIAIPVYNEQKHLLRVLQQVRLHAADCDILVVDDGSTDDTPRLLRQTNGVAVLRHPENRGYGQSLIDAFDYAKRHGYQWIITLDCDEQHEPWRIPDFLRAAAEDQADILSGSRYLKQEVSIGQPPADRRHINELITALLNHLFDLNLTDSFCGFKAYRVDALRRLRLTVPGYAFPLQFWVQVARAGLRVQEIPIRLIYSDASRHFGGNLDDPAVRLQHYIEVLVRELVSPAGPVQAPAVSGQACRCSQL